jgi:hypothetical protein
MRNIILFCIVLLFESCGSEYQHSFSEEDIQAALNKHSARRVVLEKNGLVLKEVSDIPPFRDVKVELMHKNVKFRNGVNKLEFTIDKFILGEKTVAEDEVRLSKENGGQYLMVVGNEGEENFSGHVKKKFDLGENHLLAFLCRSYGISLKSGGCYTFHEIKVDDLDGSIKTDTKQPFLYLNEPKKNEKLTVYDPVLLDFYLVNFVINEGGNYLKLTVDKTEFKLTKWSAFVITGLSVGEHVFTLQVFSKDGKIMPGELLTKVKTKIEITEGLVFE